MSPITTGQAPLIIPRPEHSVSRANISRNALKVLYRLNQAGFQAFLVGGGVRDLLLEREPKDFDIATDAHPEEVRKLFRNCRLIGRRFRLAHVHFGPEVIEVATFRALGDDAGEGGGDDEGEDDAGDSGRNGDRVVDDSGRILRDNVYGTIDDDVWRRDFTANALYYNIADYSIWDYAGGVQDIADRTLRMIGDPARRYQEDPVRMLRAIRFAAKLGFRLDPDTEAPIREFGNLLLDVPPARLLDETLKLLLGGAGRDTLTLLREYGLLQYLFPATAEVLAGAGPEHDRRLIELGLDNSDRRVGEGKSVTPVFLFCVLLWSSIRDLADRLGQDDAGAGDGVSLPTPHALRDATFEITSAQQDRVSIPRRFAQGMADILTLQPRFRHQQGRHALRLLEHPRFRAAWDFLALRHAAGDPAVSDDNLAFWREIQALEVDDARERITAGGTGTAGAAGAPAAPGAGESGGGEGGRRPRRRRRGGRGRRRSRPGGGRGDGSGDGPGGGGDG